MNYRLATLYARGAILSDLTVDIDVDVKDPISQIVIVYDTLNGAGGDADGYPAACVTKIELIDGSNVLYSLSGVAAQAVDFYHNQREPVNHIRYLAANYSHSVMNLNFGRYLYDPELALNPAQFGNLKLRITIDRNAGGHTSVAGLLAVFAHLFDEKAISPVGFLMHKEIKSYTLANSTHEYTDLPLDYPYRKLLVRAQRAGVEPHFQIANIKLSQDVDKVVPFNLTMNDIIRTIVSQTRPYREGILGPGTTVAKYFYCVPSYMVTFGGASWRGSAGFGQVSFYDGDGGRFSEIQDGAGGNWTVNLAGWLPHAVLDIPFGMQNDIADWFDVSGIGNLKLDITGGGSVGTAYAQIMLQKLRRY